MGDMQRFTLAILATAGLVAGDTTGLSSTSLTSPQAVDNSLYYNSYASGGGYDYEGYPVLSQGEQDRTDILSTGVFGGITVAMFLTAFAAALLGALWLLSSLLE